MTSRDVLDLLSDVRVDAVLVQDMGVARIIAANAYPASGAACQHTDDDQQRTGRSADEGDGLCARRSGKGMYAG